MSGEFQFLALIGWNALVDVPGLILNTNQISFIHYWYQYASQINLLITAYLFFRQYFVLI